MVALDKKILILLCQKKKNIYFSFFDTDTPSQKHCFLLPIALILKIGFCPKF